MLHSDSFPWSMEKSSYPAALSGLLASLPSNTQLITPFRHAWLFWLYLPDPSYSFFFALYCILPSGFDCNLNNTWDNLLSPPWTVAVISPTLQYTLAYFGKCRSQRVADRRRGSLKPNNSYSSNSCPVFAGEKVSKRWLLLASWQRAARRRKFIWFLRDLWIALRV